MLKRLFTRSPIRLAALIAANYNTAPSWIDPPLLDRRDDCIIMHFSAWTHTLRIPLAKEEEDEDAIDRC